ncbi:MAG TPA: SRPBCC domain-containing protein [Cyclobacteriaceae bacterium]|nr:SRPBCC domain-containing protein [Cyclobacteriaceae bacterium]
MNTTSVFDFTVDKSTKTVTITMEFSAPLSLVWDAFTKKEILDQWYAPKPFISRTKRLDFKVGGKRFYAMVGPDGKEMWILQTYISITPKTNFKLFNVFADENEKPQPPGSDWNLNFSEAGDKTNRRTKVNISIYNESLERMERMMAMGFKGGIEMQLKQLEALLASRTDSV